MRKVLAITLLALFCLPFLQPLALALAPQTAAEQNLPACCRRNGAHHCSMRMSLPPSGQPTLQSHCPCEDQTSAPAHVVTPHHVVSPGLLASLLLAHPTGLPQTESRLRLAQERARHKRGPPSLRRL